MDIRMTFSPLQTFAEAGEYLHIQKDHVLGMALMCGYSFLPRFLLLKPGRWVIPFLLKP
jgi:hypothetical protein